jgi:methyltransferase (TIGR00027 family)
MRDGQPSLTARGVTLIRAGLERSCSTDGDPTIDARLAATFELPGGPVRRPGMVRYLAARTRFFDDHLTDALAVGCDQVVIVGAGYDTRGQRFRTTGVEFFELDHPATQRDKRTRIEAIGASVEGIRFVAVDFEVDDVADALAEAGHDAGRPTFFLCEGVTVYLTEPAIERLLSALARSARPASTLAISMPVRAQDRSDGDAGSDADRRAARAAFERRLVEAGEPRRTSLTPEQGQALLARTGWMARPPTGDPERGGGSPRLVLADRADAT